MKKVFIVHSSMAYVQLFKELGYAITNNTDEADLAVFTGGEDVTPAYYGDKAHHHTYNNPLRDGEEKNLFEMFKKHLVPCVGICRGGQFLNVMCGGRMYQHVDKHAVARGHSITDLDTGDVIHVSSTHHQMMMPQGNYKLIATANLGGFREWYDGNVFKKDVSKEDIEVVFYPAAKSLCFQPHPEFNGAEYEQMKVYFKHLLNKYLEV